ncbi:bacillithiol biosynthesis deacetylase BshB1 [Bacillus sp. 03113]|uniref:bacillithiol biosynthesis deacetylase BshB1 n=1 Tax=Bacillus sp. 03113 TaxID=2578211 RepID=UPI001143F5C2|nr:bacillithiol biosynthesis deacetylase BshB1 [Bacillus sp. 03113]
MTNSDLHILAFGAHPDDVEIGMGGTLAKYAEAGMKIGICDLTNAELSSNGTVEIRREEAMRAGQILGVQIRETLDLPDRGLFLQQESIRKIVRMIRKYKPKAIFAPYWEDRHPDHGHCAQLVEEAVFSAAVKKYDHNEGLLPHRVQNLFFYMINGYHKPDFVIDITKFMDKKRASLQAYKSQFIKDSNSYDTPLVNGYIEAIEARESLYGKDAGVTYAEGFKGKKPLLIYRDLLGEGSWIKS